ncbi:MAG: flagellar biosynthesis regulator FlaF [Alphaproteobacteria bacterium]
MADPYRRYNQVAGLGEISHRAAEAMALFTCARDLALVVDHWDQMKDQLDGALEKNRLLWTFLATEVTENSALTDEIKQNVLNLAMFVFKRTFELISTPSADGVGVLININRTLATGLSREPDAEGA